MCTSRCPSGTSALFNSASSRWLRAFWERSTPSRSEDGVKVTFYYNVPQGVNVKIGEAAPKGREDGRGGQDRRFGGGGYQGAGGYGGGRGGQMGAFGGGYGGGGVLLSSRKR